MFLRVWPMLKTWRRLGIGPVEFVFSFRRRPRRSAGISIPQASPALERRMTSQTPISKEVPKEEELLKAQHSLGTAVVVGAGPGLGHALARRLAGEGFDLILITRDAEKNRKLANELATLGSKISTMSGDATDETSVLRLFAAIEAACGIPSLVVYSLQEFGPGTTVEVSAPAFESAWRHNCLGAFLVGRSAARAMSKAKRGTLVFIGSTSSIIGRAGHLNLAVGKFGQRAVSQVLAREMWPLGVHVAHLMIDADIQESEDDPHPHPHPQSCPREIAESILAIHKQPRTAWSSEMDLRPWNETFWNHC
jgi:NAD(P)-dependent dehydrogenase (short-subunit alcohol dehydrogenase family)